MLPERSLWWHWPWWCSQSALTQAALCWRFRKFGFMSQNPLTELNYRISPWYMKRALTSGLVFGSGSAIFTSMDLGKELPPGVCRIYCRGLSIADESAWYIMAFIVCWLVTKSCLTLCDPMDCSRPDLLVPHCLPEFVVGYPCCLRDFHYRLAKFVIWRKFYF